jgi:CRP-like cAMP-binding protein
MWRRKSEEETMFIQEADLFKGVSRKILNKISRNMIEESYKEGDFIIKEGDPADHFYILQEGKIRLSVGKKGQVTNMLSNAGEAFGWSSLLNSEAYPTSAECVVSSKLIKIEKRKLDKIFERDPANGFIFFKGLAETIGQRLINSYSKLIAISKEEGPPSYG